MHFLYWRNRQKLLNFFQIFHTFSYIYSLFEVQKVSKFDFYRKQFTIIIILSLFLIRNIKNFHFLLLFLYLNVLKYILIHKEENRIKISYYLHIKKKIYEYNYLLFLIQFHHIIQFLYLLYFLLSIRQFKVFYYLKEASLRIDFGSF
ncbi:hypothetical protein IMG5_067900 [Ichthyophthirius multifiliis]|uniref:Transmembrane protein n=1 Tax=Ichthyophthirius multifiliis TaxID=5932 RepID=G0QPH1_ICHMU|nr:hypothetical protein IMG5_067900 [Ichthyophthirius multifiliis]EGR32883.1 hypothetical protein IMG5_067900 [Ichthyophthirius multifiliis]|eukprot:XP_004036869.1 hypothetical protein IMG5_067900 [Ichthyophthirius multifiliis]